MKKLILTASVVLALAAAGMQSAQANDRGWATVGKVLTGIVAFDVISHAVAPRPCYSTAYSYPAPCSYNYGVPQTQVVYAQPVVYSQPVVVAPVTQVVYSQPVVVYSAPVISYPAPVFVHYQGYRGCW